MNRSSGASDGEPDDWHPRYHLAPKFGFMNDPNGLIYHDGYYHAFYQHNPFEAISVMNKVSWGHARSKDMVNWEHLPVALPAATIPEDMDGCFSGSAVIHDGKMHLIYTGNTMVDGANGTKQMYQVQCLATSDDAVTFTKQGKVLAPPKDIIHFRDPKVWKEGDLYHMVIGMGQFEKGFTKLYTSKDLREWKDEGELSRVDNMGYVWECPDLFTLNDKHVLMFSPQGIQKHKGYDHRNLYQTGYMIGTWKLGEQFNIEKQFQEMDFGHDFYAPQSFVAADGRRIAIAWMDMWETPMPEQKHNWAGTFSLPRELSLSSDGQKIKVKPIREVETLRSKDDIKVDVKNITNEYIKIAEDVKSMEIILTWNQKDSVAEKYGLVLGDKDHSDGGTYLYIDNQARRLILDRKYPNHGISGYRSAPLVNEDPITWRVFFDGSMIEVFVDDGEYSASSRIYPSKEQRVLSLFAENGLAKLIEGKMWQLG